MADNAEEKSLSVSRRKSTAAEDEFGTTESFVKTSDTYGGVDEPFVGGSVDLTRSSFGLWWQHLLALMKRNALIKTRNWKVTTGEIMLPVIVMIAMLGIRIAIEKSDEPANLHLDQALSFQESAAITTLGQILAFANFKIAFTPDVPAVRDMRNKLIQDYPIMAQASTVFPNEESMVDYIESDEYAKEVPGIYGAAVFDKIGTNTQGDRNWAYTMRFNATGQGGSGFNGSLANFPFKAVPNTFRQPFTDNEQLNYVSVQWRRYFFLGFANLQLYLERYMVNASTGVQTTNQIKVQPFPTVAHTFDEFADILAAFLGLLFTLAYLWPVTRVIGTLVEEKELKLKESMMMMGLRDSALFLSWLLTYAFIFFVMSITIIIVTGSTVYELSDKGLVFFFFFLFGLCVFAFCYLLSSFFSRANVASTMGALIFLASFFPYFVISEDGSAGQKGMACLSAPICFGIGATIIAKLESAQQGLTNSTVGTEIDDFTFGAVISMLIVDFVLYLLLGLYFSRIVPSKYGISESCCFCCTPRFCCGRQTVQTGEFADDKEIDDEDTRESVPSKMFKKIGIRVRNLQKEFPTDDGPPVVAVNNVNMNIFEDQIFALLGHNGAGKTTTINMMSGLYPPTRGDSQVYGMSILNGMANIRRSLGVCPQHDILWPSLTVREHLELFASIKGMYKADIPKAVTEIIQAVGLTEKEGSRSGTLSGGQKRKLSVGIALIGGSRVVFMDEPTSGMDPYSRRSTWELLRQAKRGRVIILTTHFMDEADALGDRIAIMAKGQLRCVGSSLFLKNLYGVGYSMTVSTKSGQEHSAIKSLVHSHVPTAEVLSEAAGEISFRLPFAAAKAFPELFHTMDTNQDELSVESYGMSVTTLEEVFLRVGRDEASVQEVGQKPAITNAEDEAKQADPKNASAKVAQAPLEIEEGDSMMAASDASGVRHFRALITKRWHNSKRDRKVWTWQFVYPFLIMLCGLGLLKLGQSFSFPSVDLNTSNLNTPLRVPYNSNNNISETPIGGLLPSTFANNAIGLGVNVSSDVAMSQYLLNSYFDYKESRYGAYNFHSWNNNHFDFTVYINTTCTHALPVFLNFYSNMLMQKLSNQDPSARISLVLDPLPRTSDQKALQNSFTAVFFGIGFAFIPASFIAFIIKERNSKAKHLQLISGVDTTAYWLATYFWDYMNYLVAGLLAFIIVAIYDIEQMLGEAAPVVLLAILLFGLSVCPFTYIVSFYFDNSVSGQNTMLLINIFCGAILLIVSIILDIIESTQDINSHLKFVYRLIPNFCFGEVIANVIVRDTTVAFGGDTSPWNMDVSGWPLLFMFLSTPVYFCIVLAIEYVLRTPELLAKFITPPTVEDAPHEEDKDVIAERERIATGKADKDMIQLRGLRKVYPGRMNAPPKAAVKNLSFGIPEGQCFGFLGINGAGKTTTLSMLTGDVIPSSGTARLNGLDIMTQQAEVRHYLGYCPQFDALIETLTAREHLYLFARIKGIPEVRIAQFANNLIDKLGLSEYADRPCGGYSGGNKRKLSVGMALIGNPAIVFLDEPSTGMDPKSRRFMWTLISSSMKGRSVILTTHSMEECEALCSRIGIMVSGRLRCIGSAQHLKSRYGDGFQIDINTGVRSIKSVQKFFLEHFPEAKVIERHLTSVKYRIPRADHKLGSLFELMEANKDEMHISEYSVSETTLEQIFIHFARQQEEEKGPVTGFVDLDAPEEASPASPLMKSPASEHDGGQV